MADLHGFDARNVEPSTEFEALPAGRYVAAIVESEMKPTKNGSGSFLELKFQVLDGEHKGRHLWARLNLDNPNAMAVKIARGELSAICRAVGVLTPNDSVDLHDIPLAIKVKVKKRQDTGDLTNEIAAYEKKGAAAGEPQQAQEDTPPWAR